ncbi:MAG: glycosyltransferase [Planctomycetota bacterium]
MRIDFVITELDVGGAESALAHIAVGLAERGDDVRVFSLAPPPARKGIVERLMNASIPIEFGNATSAFHFPATLRHLRSWLRRGKADVVQSFLFHANVLTSIAGIGRSHVAGVRVADPSRWRSLVERWALRSCPSIVCVSNAVAEFVRHRLVGSVDRVRVIHNGVDADRFAGASPAPWTDVGLPADAIVTLFVGRLHQQKGLDCLEEQADSIAPSGSDRWLVLVGDGPLKSHWQSLSDQKPNRNVRWLPWMEDISGVMAACRVLVLPSRYEGMPNVVLEAMAAGRPVVCSDVEGSQELVGNDARQRFSVGDSVEMNQKLDGFLSDASLAAKTGRANQALVSEKFSIDAMVERYHELYESLGCQNATKSVS